MEGLTMNYCPNCGVALQEKSKFCGACGKAINEFENKTVNRSQSNLDTKNYGFMLSRIILPFIAYLIFYLGSNKAMEFFEDAYYNANLKAPILAIIYIIGINLIGFVIAVKLIPNGKRVFSSDKNVLIYKIFVGIISILFIQQIIAFLRLTF